MMEKSPKKKKSRSMIGPLRKQAKTIIAKKLLDKPMSYKPGGKKLITDLPYVPRP